MKRMMSFAVAALVLCVAFGCGKKEEQSSAPANPSEPVVEVVENDGVDNGQKQQKQQIQKQEPAPKPEPKPEPKPNVQKQDEVDVNQDVAL